MQPRTLNWRNLPFYEGFGQFACWRIDLAVEI